MLNCKYGHFSQDGREFIITNPLTPRPWINVISNGQYSMVISQTGGGYSFRYNAEQNRLTRAYQDLIKDNWGKYYYIRDLSDNTFWSASYLPIKDNIEEYSVRHGIGYSEITRQSYGIKSQVKVFVSCDMPMEYAVVTLTNNRQKSAKLDLTSYFEWAPGIAYDTHREFQKLFTTTSFNKKLNSILVDKCLWGFPDEKGRWNNDDWPFKAFHACSAQVASFDCDKESFIGMYNDEKTPSALTQKDLAGRSGRYGDAVASLRTKPITLKPQESATVVFAIGVAKKDGENYIDMINRCSSEGAEKDFQEVTDMWERLTTNSDTVKTPDQAFDVMTNTWCKYQTLSGRMWAKCGYYQISGGIGFRDQLQDSLLMLDTAPDYTAKQITLHASRQFQAGDVQHWWLEIGGAGPRTKCSDDYLWLHYVLEKYIDETADFSILKQVIPFVDSNSATLYEHCRRGLLLAFERVSPRGIPLMGDHDWNDGLSAVGNDMKGESFWVAEFLYLIAKNFIPLAQQEKDGELVALIEANCDKIKEAFEKYAWDGGWYLQATNDLGALLGSEKCEHGKIFLNPQTWAVISGIASAERQKIAMNAVSEHLLRDYGALLLYPEYDNPDKNIGYITRYAPGLRENGGVYSHAATWAVWAYAKLGDNEKAYQAYKRICPPNRLADVEKYFCEPYVMCGNSDGPTSPNFGRGGWSWYTGSAQWLHNVAVHCILGISSSIDGLVVSPCIPKDWAGFTYQRKFRKGSFNFLCKRGENKGIYLDGTKIDGNVIPQMEGAHEVEIII